MSILLICILIFVLFMVAGYAGLALQTRLVDEHKTGDTKAVVGQVSRPAFVSGWSCDGS